MTLIEIHLIYFFKHQFKLITNSMRRKLQVQRCHATTISVFEFSPSVAIRLDGVWDQDWALSVLSLVLPCAVIMRESGSVEDASRGLRDGCGYVGVTVKKVLKKINWVRHFIQSYVNLHGEVDGASHLDSWVVLVLLNLWAEVLTSVDQSDRSIWIIDQLELTTSLSGKLALTMVLPLPPLSVSYCSMLSAFWYVAFRTTTW